MVLITDPQAKALINWCAAKDSVNRILDAITFEPKHRKQRTTMLPNNAYFMFKHLKNAQLILYPDSGHGVLFHI